MSAKGGQAASEILVEDFIEGREVALEGLLREGELKVLALFDKPDPLDGPFFEETIYVTPSRLPAGIQERVAQVASHGALALGLRDGPVHAELRVNDAGAWLIEIAARSIGGLCSRTLRFGTGMSLEEVILRHALRMEMPEPEREKRAAGVMMIPIPRAGTLEEVRGLEEARAVRRHRGRHHLDAFGTARGSAPRGIALPRVPLQPRRIAGASPRRRSGRRTPGSNS